MGQACSTAVRKKRSKLQRNVRHSKSQPEFTHPVIQPPPYTDERESKRDFFLPKLNRRISSLQDEKIEEQPTPPDLEDHPALRNSRSSITESTFNLKGHDPNRPSSAPGNKGPTVPKPTHKRSVSFLDPTLPKSPSPVPTLPEYSSSPKFRIHADSVPQWRWTNSQCRTWITDVLIVYGGKDAQTARELASTFRGFGPNLYMKEWKQWNSWLGPDGQAIFALLMEVHEEEGAVPKEVEIAHYRREAIVAWGLEVGSRASGHSFRG
ncbi:hypothetical protein L207DRAFT_567639 [Hyaloscypha variabilis F]|uniref:Uncharacterized protein n=1 Tax=Hyaloscypha variabilis (strain UAMH 11265 / GT02V1 / F) TaxID=1149755 RepID=A0A2J6RH68_HYAVF|nr:hypothetical protein L207DRAFT_567639 [Hyaloscypha variabilis F]